jgi:hypothetical protein
MRAMNRKRLLASLLPGMARLKPRQVAAAQIDQQAHHVGLEMPKLGRVAKCSAKGVQEIAQVFVAAYNGFKHGFLASGLASRNPILALNHAFRLFSYQSA